MAVAVITALLVFPCALALRRAESGRPAWQDVALVLTWAVSLWGFLIVIGAFLVWTLPTGSDIALSGSEVSLLPVQFMLAMGGALCWWRATAERSRLRYRRALAWLGAGVLCCIAWGAALELIV